MTSLNIQVSKAEHWKPAGSVQGLKMACGCFPMFGSLCASYIAWSTWEHSGPLFTLFNTYCKGIGWHLWLPACWQPHRCSSHSVPQWHWPPSAETGSPCSWSPDHWRCLSCEDRRGAVTAVNWEGSHCLLVQGNSTQLAREDGERKERDLRKKRPKKALWKAEGGNQRKECSGVKCYW